MPEILWKLSVTYLLDETDYIAYILTLVVKILLKHIIKEALIFGQKSEFEQFKLHHLERRIAFLNNRGWSCRKSPMNSLA